MSLKTRTAVVLAIGSLIVALVCWLFIREQEPQYEGRSLSDWVEMYGYGENQTQAAKAIRTIGTNAFPLLLEWIREPEPDRHPSLVRIAGMFPRRLRPKWAFEGYVSRPYLAAFGFQALGAEASPIIPELVALGATTKNPEAAGLALTALSHIGSTGVSALLAAIRDPSHPHRETAIFVLGVNYHLGPDTELVVAELITRLDDPPIADSAASALGMIKGRPNLTVPALSRRLGNTNLTSNSRLIAATSLISFGRDAAQPLTNALTDPDPVIRQTVAQAIKDYRIHNQ